MNQILFFFKIARSYFIFLFKVSAVFTRLEFYKILDCKAACGINYFYSYYIIASFLTVSFVNIKVFKTDDNKHCAKTISMCIPIENISVNLVFMQAGRINLHFNQGLSNGIITLYN